MKIFPLSGPIKHLKAAGVLAGIVADLLSNVIFRIPRPDFNCTLSMPQFNCALRMSKSQLLFLTLNGRENGDETSTSLPAAMSGDSKA